MNTDCRAVLFVGGLRNFKKKREVLVLASGLRPLVQRTAGEGQGAAEIALSNNGQTGIGDYREDC